MGHCPPALPFDVSVTGMVISGRVLFKGASLRESTGSATARLEVRDGSATGRLLDVFTFQANESATDWFPEFGLSVEQGVFYNVAAGAGVGTVYVIPESRLEGFSIDDLYLMGET